MAFSDTQGGRRIYAAEAVVFLSLSGTVLVGDPIGYSSGWKRADANATIKAHFIALRNGESGDHIPVAKKAHVGGFSGGTAGNNLYLSDTPGQYSASASGTYNQILGYMVTATEGWVAPEAYETGEITVSKIAGDLDVGGHSQSLEFMANAFQYPSPGSDWTPQVEGAGLGASLSSKKVWLPLNFLKIGDEIVSYKLVGDVVEANTVTVDCKLVRVNKADAPTTTDVSGGGITQVDADGNFDAEATLASAETVATDKQYVLEIQGSTGASDSITVLGAEVKINRKV